MYKKKLAIIGGGISGIYAAYKLQDKFNITLYEQSDYFGGNNYSYKISENIYAPMGVIIFPEKKVFPTLYDLAIKLNLEIEPKQIFHTFFNNNKLMYSTAKLDIFNHINIKFIKDFWYLFNNFNLEKDNNITILEWAKFKKISHSNLKYFLLPFASLYLSVSFNELFNLPISVIARWWLKYSTPISSLRKYWIIKDGNHKLIEELIKSTNASFNNNTKVIKLKRNLKNIELTTKKSDYIFDKVIFATNPNQILKIIENPIKLEVETFNKIKTNSLLSILHTDKSLCYKNSMTIKVININKSSHVVSTWNQDIFSNKVLKKPNFISIHEDNMSCIDNKYILQKKKFHVAIPTISTLDTISNVQILNKLNNNIFYCGSYTSPSFYHEDGLNSVNQIIKRITNT
ncbi:FAD-dependent oxidoreductase [Gammaproteobacteria bacterium]|nr:FAD-dependent oxidoreductase [Gammaproteobacteria bacterium]